MKQTKPIKYKLKTKQDICQKILQIDINVELFSIIKYIWLYYTTI